MRGLASESNNITPQACGLYARRSPDPVARNISGRTITEDCAARAARLGWDAIGLFGCAARRPLDYSASAGLLWAMNGGRLVELHRDWAVIDVPLQTRQRVFDRRKVERTKISLPWTKKAA